MINRSDITQQLIRNAEAIRALLENISDEQAHWKPNPDAWSLQDTLTHLYNEERVDFRKHLREMFSQPPQPWARVQPGEILAVDSCQQALEGFLSERKDSIEWLAALNNPDWEIKTETPWGSISSGYVFVSWVEHDFLHSRQLNELLFAWHESQAAPYSVEYAGGW